MYNRFKLQSKNSATGVHVDSEQGFDTLTSCCGVFSSKSEKMSNTTLPKQTQNFSFIRKNGALYRVEHEVQFKDESGQVIAVVEGFDSDASIDAFLAVDANWPDSSVRCTRYDEDKFVRELVYGVEYGRGSLVATYGRGNVPTRFYQYQDANHR